MSKHLNPSGFRLGLLQIWNSNFIVYGKSFINYNTIFFIKKSIKNYIKYNFKKCENFGILINSEIYFNYWILTIYFFSPKIYKYIKLYNVLQKIQISCYYWTKVPLIIKCYKQKSWVNVAFFLAEYIKFVFLKSKLSFKSLLNFLESLLVDKLQEKIIYHTIFGFKLKKIRGIKICCKGCLGNIRNPLTQTFKKSLGSNSFSKINSYIDYNQTVIFTKRGVYGLKIWIFSSY